jgi:hypothetical protein
MGKRFRRKHVVKIVMISLYGLMILSMVVGWSLRGY